MDINTKLFNLLKSHEWDKFTSIIKNTKNIDFNIRDNSQNYLLQYAILYNKVEIVKLLIEKKAKTDIYDYDGRNILYNPIKFNYFDIVNELLNTESKNIGITISEMPDNKGYYPIHYAIIFGNINMINIFDKYNKYFNQLDKNNNTCLHFAVKTKNLEIFKIILKKSFEINFQNLQGESIVHLICNYNQESMLKEVIQLKNLNVNIQDYENEISPLMYTVISSDFTNFKILLDKSNINLQDINGNTVLHYCIIEKNYDFINYILEKDYNYNITNIHGQTFLHLLLSNYTENQKIYIENIIKNTNLNIQDNYGNSCFLIICYLKLWKNFSNIIELQPINFLLKNKENIDSLYYIDKNELDDYYNLISKSYINYIRKQGKENINYIQNIVNLCKNNLSYSNYSKIENILPDNINNKLKKTDKDVCLRIFNFLLKNKNLQFPRKIKNYCINLDDYIDDINFITYTGTTLDVLFGLIFIINNFNNIKTSLTTDFIENSKLENYYLNQKNRKIKKQDFINFEIIWDGIKIFYPTILDFLINKFKSDDKINFLIIPLGIELENGSHSNILIYDKSKDEIERFEPNGGSYPYKFNYNPILLDRLLKNKFLTYFDSCKYFKPQTYLPKIGFQLLESYDHFKTKKIGDPGGFCAVWCVWYGFMRLKYNLLSREKLVIKLIQKIKEENVPFKTIVRNFAKKIVDIRDELFEKSNLDINKWLNSSYEEANYDDFIINLQKNISSII